MKSLGEKKKREYLKNFLQIDGVKINKIPYEIQSSKENYDRA